LIVQPPEPSVGSPPGHFSIVVLLSLLVMSSENTVGAQDGLVRHSTGAAKPTPTPPSVAWIWLFQSAVIPAQSGAARLVPPTSWQEPP
jgi:hypothetical protein